MKLDFSQWLIEMAANTKDELKRMGYDFRVSNSLPQRFSIVVYKDKTWIAEASFTQDEDFVKNDNPHWADIWDDEQDSLKPNEMWITNVWTDPNHQRLGIATAMYQLAQEITGNKIVRTSSSTPDSDALWDQKDRPF